MRLNALTWSRYRAFKEPVRVEIAPINIIIGKNGSGKSVLARLVVLLAASVKDDASGPIDLTAGGIDHGTAFQDLVNNRSQYPFALGAEISDGNSSYSFESTLRYIPETRAIIVEEFWIKANENILLSIKLSSEEQLVSPAPRYKWITEHEALEDEAVAFSGLFPIVTDVALIEVFDLFRSALGTPSYLGPFRTEPQHFMRTPNQGISTLGPRGERALEMLADDRLRQGGRLAQDVQEWFGKNLGQSVEVDVTAEQPIVRAADSQTGFAVSLSDTGAGFSQSLPIVVQHLAYRAGRLDAPILIVEQPELHLHPAAHGALADLIVGTANGGETWAPATCLVETHSEQFIMRIRRRVAEGMIAPQAVRIWSLNHIDAASDEADGQQLRVISLDNKGNPDSWPSGVFEEAFEDLAAMRQAGRDRTP